MNKCSTAVEFTEHWRFSDGQMPWCAASFLSKQVLDYGLPLSSLSALIADSFVGSSWSVFS
jgi:hypothetical protein